MSFQFDETHVYDGQHLVCPENKVPIALGVALTKIKGSQYVQGPSLFGADKKFPTPYATVMIHHQLIVDYLRWFLVQVHMVLLVIHFHWQSLVHLLFLVLLKRVPM